ncbi:putative bifunctional diguanylate cyclase/phosphodiesterase [Paenibacillus silviterrae]|uniref:putative bifunctional diguanylate cyclase/phosphodiesterase n=1 Tax=Paenibacillus silviterrae TaxID=3242194 RepID=UPI002543B959|nr:bifunctional diguanylate cyclase/phosphodiesterase [Paenibacillus chinjuensis]
MGSVVLLILLMPMFFLLYCSIEIFKRDPKNKENQAAAGVMFTLFFIFLSDYAQIVLPGSFTLGIAIYVKYPATLLCGTFALMFHFLIARRYHSVPWGWLRTAALMPVLVYFAILFTQGHQVLVGGARTEAMWKLEQPELPLVLLLGCMALFSFINFGISLKAWLQTRNRQEKRRFLTLIQAHLLVGASGMLCWWLSQRLEGHVPIPSTLSILPIFVWGFAIRLLMNRSDLLPSASSKFEVLYKINPTAILLMDRQLVVQEANPSSVKMFGGELLYTPLYRYLNEGEEALEGKITSEALLMSPWVNRECTLVTLTGQRKTVLVDTDTMVAGGERYVLAVIRDITARKQEELYTQYIAHHDPLTGLANRLKFNQMLEEKLAEAERKARKLAVLLIDLDRFKFINDTLGHQFGDEALIELSNRLTEAIGEQGVVTRLGGDEFALLLPGINEIDEVILTAESILQLFLRPVELQEREFYLAASIGISLYPNDGDSTSHLMKNADIAMYHAKSSGGNQYRFYTQELNAALRRHVDMETALRKSLENGELELYYQPQYDLAADRLTGAEALLRWHSKELGAVSPVEFIPLAEQSGLIVMIGQWVLEEACREAVGWAGLSDYPMTVSVNVSAIQLMQPDFVYIVTRALRATGLPAGQLCLEITESMVMDKLTMVMKTLDELVALGIHISMDDFGTGYSSLSVIQQLPVSSIKIDRSFIMNMTEEQLERSIVPAIISMSHMLGKEVVAEGVENAEQLNILRGLHCDTGQGYFFSKPLPAEEMIRFITGLRNSA